MSKPTNWGMYIKMAIAGIGISVGGPLLIMKVSPTEEEIREKYNPELKKRAIEGADQRQQEFNDFVQKLKEYSKSDKHIWQAAKEYDDAQKESRFKEARRVAEEIEARKAAMRKDNIKPVPGGGL